MYKAGIIVASDKGSIGLREDTSGLAIKEILTNKGFEVLEYVIIPDDLDVIRDKLIEFSDIVKLNLIISTGGTGFSKRDVTPEATLQVITRRTSGISEAIRYNSLKITPRGMLSRGESGFRNGTLIINLPGSKKAVSESLEYIIDSVIHGLDIYYQNDSECGNL